MLDPMQAHYVSAHTPSEGYQNLDEEELAQRHGQVVVSRRSVWNPILVWVGKLLIRIGKKLAAEKTQTKWNEEIA